MLDDAQYLGQPPMVDRNPITGQNPSSTDATAAALFEALALR